MNRLLKVLAIGTATIGFATLGLASTAGAASRVQAHPTTPRVTVTVRVQPATLAAAGGAVTVTLTRPVVGECTLVVTPTLVRAGRHETCRQLPRTLALAIPANQASTSVRYRITLRTSNPRSVRVTYVTVAAAISNPTTTTTTPPSASGAPVVISSPANAMYLEPGVTSSGGPTTTGPAPSFTATASGQPTPSVQWYATAPGGTTALVPGATSSTLTLSNPTSFLSYRFFATFTNSVGSASTASAVLESATPSANWAGYVDTAPTGQQFTHVAGSWNVPAVTCSGAVSQFMVQWVGIDGAPSQTVEQAGTDQICVNGITTYGAFYEMYGDSQVQGGQLIMIPNQYPVAGGDRVSGSISVTSGVWTITLVDATAGWTFTVTVPGPAGGTQQSSAEWIAETPQVCSTTSACTISSAPSFSPTVFTGASATLTGPGATAVPAPITGAPFTAVYISNGSTVTVAPSALDPTGSSFTVSSAG